MKNDDGLRQQLIDSALAMNTRGINQGTSGNLSVRVAGGYLITPSGLPYEDCNPSDIVFIDDQTRAHGIRKPSSEWRFHDAIYRNRPNIGAVLHAHSPWCTTLACLERPIPAFHYMVAVAGGHDIRCAPYATFGTEELSHHAIKALQDRLACLLAHHGMIAINQDISAVLSLAAEVENIARVYCQALAIGEPNTLDDQEMERVLEKFSHYGARAQD